jgi:NAD(P)-dependent dehydrogenase (short-subunit alcohol dehydrogenase family)
MSSQQNTTPRTWFITGCVTGLGRAIAEAALHAGDNVVATVLARDGEHSLPRDVGGRLHVAHLDVTDFAASQRLVAQAQERYGEIDVLVNNAGFGLVGAAEETEPGEYRPMFEVNFFGMVELTRAVLPGMRMRRCGHVINLSSLVGIVGAAGFAFYSASKFAVEGFSESLAKEVAPLGIKVTIVEPGGFRTDFAGGSLGRVAREIGDYAGTSGMTRSYLFARNGTQPGDPALLGAALCRIAALPQPPLRLALGPDAWEQVSDKATFVAKELQQWKEISLSTSYRDPGSA